MTQHKFVVLGVFQEKADADFPEWNMPSTASPAIMRAQMGNLCALFLSAPWLRPLSASPRFEW
jgi:hypothetical protein